MTDMESKDAKLNAFLKEQVRTNLLNIGRKLVIEKGADYLTARKLSQASNVSVGTIYNQFRRWKILSPQKICRRLTNCINCCQSSFPTRIRISTLFVMSTRSAVMW